MVEVSARARKSPSCMQIYGGQRIRAGQMGILGMRAAQKRIFFYNQVPPHPNSHLAMLIMLPPDPLDRLPGLRTSRDSG